MWLNAVAMLAIATAAVALLFSPGEWKTQPKSGWAVAQLAIEFLQSHSAFLLKGGAAFVGATNLAAKQIGPDWVWKTVGNLLYDYRKVRFSCDVDDLSLIHI